MTPVVRIFDQYVHLIRHHSIQICVGNVIRESREPLCLTQLISEETVVDFLICCSPKHTNARAGGDQHVGQQQEDQVYVEGMRIRRAIISSIDFRPHCRRDMKQCAVPHASSSAAATSSSPALVVALLKKNVLPKMPLPLTPLLLLLLKMRAPMLVVPPRPIGLDVIGMALHLSRRPHTNNINDVRKKMA